MTSRSAPDDARSCALAPGNSGMKEKTTPTDYRAARERIQAAVNARLDTAKRTAKRLSVGTGEYEAELKDEMEHGAVQSLGLGDMLAILTLLDEAIEVLGPYAAVYNDDPLPRESPGAFYFPEDLRRHLTGDSFRAAADLHNKLTKGGE